MSESDLGIARKLDDEQFNAALLAAYVPDLNIVLGGRFKCNATSISPFPLPWDGTLPAIQHHPCPLHNA